MDFTYKLEFHAEPEDVFNALTNPFLIELWSGYPADMKPEKDYVFSLWDGDISGINLEIAPPKLLKQEWFFGETATPSIVTIRLTKKGNHATLLELQHTHIPDEAYDEITEGWKEYYLDAIKRMLEMY